MHYQTQPFSEAKLLTVIRGSILDILIDLNTVGDGSPTIYTFELNANRPEVLFIPKGFAHGYQTISEGTEILYALDSSYEPGSTRGFSPLSLEIKKLWPFNPTLIKEDDLKWPMLSQ
jgi:dTDP-4-dehydrorhamnose 3,5-epimerase